MSVLTSAVSTRRPAHAVGRRSSQDHSYRHGCSPSLVELVALEGTTSAHIYTADGTQPSRTRLAPQA